MFIQTEQWSAAYFKTNLANPKVINALEVWDYSCENLQHYPATYSNRTFLIPQLVASRWSNVTSFTTSSFQKRALFIGSNKSEHRNDWLRSIPDTAIDLRFSTNFVFGDDLLQLMSKRAVLVNIHYFDPPVLEMLRLVPALAAGMCIVSEDIPYVHNMRRLLETAIIFVNNSEDMASHVQTFLTDDTLLKRCREASLMVANKFSVSRWTRTRRYADV